MNVERGFGIVTAIILLVVLAGLALGISQITATQLRESAQAMLNARGQSAAKGGTEWGLYQALQSGGIWYWNPATGLPNPAPCASAQKKTLDLTSQTGFIVTVTCTSYSYNEGQTSSGSTNTTMVYVIDAVACNGSTACPDNASVGRTDYVERRRQAVVTASPSAS